jgi:uncharacterized membrane protein
MISTLAMTHENRLEADIASANRTPTEKAMLASRRLWTWLFIAVALPYVLVLVFLTPPFQVPDESEHYFYARAITTGSILPQDLPNGKRGGFVAQADVELEAIFPSVTFHFHPETKATPALFDQARRVGGADVLVPVGYSGAAVYPPLAYAVPALAMLAADALGLQRLQAFYAGRLANALLFIIAVAAAIWIAPTGRPAFAFIFLLPMSLYQAASFSADVPAFALTAMICALLVRMALTPSPAKRWLWTVAFLIVILATIKSPLIALAVPLAVLGWRVSARAALLPALAAVGIWLGWTYGFVLTDAFDARLKTIPGGVSARDQVHFILSHPLSVIPIAIETFRQKTITYVASGIGVFGAFDTPLALWFYLLALASGLAAFTCSSVSEPVKASRHFRLALAASGVIATALIFGVLYLTWTPVGASVVQGVQGRYFIPVLLVLALSVAGLRSLYPPTTERLTAAILSFFYALSLCHAPFVLLSRYYIP